MSRSLVIPNWANGPGAPTDASGTGNGGYSAGLLARELPTSGGACVELRLPPPLGRELEVRDAGDGSIVLVDGADVVMRATPAAPTLDVPDEVRALDVDAARRASAGFPFRDRHPFPQCLACGTRRPADLPSLCLHCGPVDGGPWFADAWAPGADLADAEDPEVASLPACWAALDCPSAAPFADPDAEHPSVLARITAHVLERPRIGEPCVLAARLLAVDGRKRTSRSLMLDASGTLLAVAEALWIEVRPR